MSKSASVVIIGAGVIGCSTAYHLARAGVKDIIIVEMGQVGSGVSSRSAAMLSLQFCQDELTARMALQAYQRYMQFADEIGAPIDFVKSGWLTLAGHTHAAALQTQAAMLQILGVPTEILDPAEVQRRYPEINTDDIALATWGPDDGPFDPHMIMWGYVRRATELGVSLQQGVRALGIAVQAGRVCGVHTTQGFIPTKAVINAAGPWAAEAAAWVGVDLPLRNSLRGILVTGPLPALPQGRPFVEDLAAGWYFRPEGAGVLMGMGLIPTTDLTPTLPDSLRDDMIEAAVHRVPLLAQASVLASWAGVRPLTPDGRPILGPTPSVEGFLLNTGWGGVGIIMAPVAGQLLAEIYCQTSAAAFDPALFRIERFSDGVMKS